MSEIIDIRLAPEFISDREYIGRLIRQKQSISTDVALYFRLIKRSIDARQKKVVYQLRYEYSTEEALVELNCHNEFKAQDVSQSREIAVIGAGPAGIFAALRLIENGYKPLIFDRGKDVQARRRDLRAIQQESIVNTESNYCYGEGGAGTYSDGKLYTRSTKRGDLNRVLKILVAHGAQEDILIDAHPHIGSNKLPQVIKNIRTSIEDCGGRYFFDHKLEDLDQVSRDSLKLTFGNGFSIHVKSAILATGHSARDIYRLLDRKNLAMEAKPFALGVRAEHDQQFVNQSQYHQNQPSTILPPASYSLKHTSNTHSSFSFCMCPGGLIVPAATSPGEIVVNGMSLSRRDSPYANSGIVVTVDPSKMKDFGHYGLFSSLEFQKKVERDMFEFGDGSLAAPAQRLSDFVNRKVSTTLNPTSYIPGLITAPLHEMLPENIQTGLQEGFKAFGRKMPGYITENANIVGVESRTSAPVRIVRNNKFCNHPQYPTLYPCGEGAGYAGGIISAALDGERVVHGMMQYFDK
ncbi:NAD(P)/FAD-dependent oxidoreductase [Membranihabitans marinus]|uniref:NAD(P)/FAD-dependent oxidoreductase n=1 Tax=Membranihabitans marinus TaxID=1227546 RepID=UPI001F19322D|nr:FAD-dependent oxidoreductase [Membranihabitans marinus]